jgi:PAX-interacting protein 1
MILRYFFFSFASYSAMRFIYLFVDPSFQSDYLRKISLKMLTMETKSQNPIANSLPYNAAVSSDKPPDPGI